MDSLSNLQLRSVSLYDKQKIEKWDAFVESHPEGTPYHMGGWLRTIQNTYGFLPELYIVQDTRENIVAAIPIFIFRSLLRRKRIISLPFSDFGGLLFNGNSKAAEIIGKILLSKAENTSCIEIRGGGHKFSGFLDHKYYKRHMLDLQREPHEIVRGINKRTIRYSIRKAENAGISVRESHNESGMREFIRLNAITRKRHGVPSQPKKWFDALQKNVIATGKGVIFLAEYNSKIIGSSVFLACGRSLHYKYNASDLSSLGSLSPNHLITWTAIKWGVKNNFEVMDFGRTAPDNKGLMRYKAMWGVSITDLPYFYYPKIQGAASVKEATPAFRLLTGLWKLIPDKLAEKLSAIIFKQLA